MVRVDSAPAWVPGHTRARSADQSGFQIGVPPLAKRRRCSSCPGKFICGRGDLRPGHGKLRCCRFGRFCGGGEKPEGEVAGDRSPARSNGWRRSSRPRVGHLRGRVQCVCKPARLAVDLHGPHWSGSPNSGVWKAHVVQGCGSLIFRRSAPRVHYVRVVARMVGRTSNLECGGRRAESSSPPLLNVSRLGRTVTAGLRGAEITGSDPASWSTRKKARGGRCGAAQPPLVQAALRGRVQANPSPRARSGPAFARGPGPGIKE